MSEKNHVEMIEEFIHNGGDYEYFDNHGYLTRCRDCTRFSGEKTACWCDMVKMFVLADNYCSWYDRKEGKA